MQADWRQVSVTVVHVFTHFRLELTVWTAHLPRGAAAPGGCWWAPADGLADEALPSVMKKAIEAAVPGATRRRPHGRAA